MSALPAGSDSLDALALALLLIPTVGLAGFALFAWAVVRGGREDLDDQACQHPACAAWRKRWGRR